MNAFPILRLQAMVSVEMCRDTLCCLICLRGGSIAATIELSLGTFAYMGSVASHQATINVEHDV